MKKLFFVSLFVTAFSVQSHEFIPHDYIFPDGLKNYTEGTKVAHLGSVFECRPFPSSGYCSLWDTSTNQYEPGEGVSWESAWKEVKGVDFNFHFPDQYKIYQAGTRVEFRGQTYKCKEFPDSGYCVQWGDGNVQYAPGQGLHWKMAWVHLSKAGVLIPENPLQTKDVNEIITNRR